MKLKKIAQKVDWLEKAGSPNALEQLGLQMDNLQKDVQDTALEKEASVTKDALDTTVDVTTSEQVADEVVRKPQDAERKTEITVTNDAIYITKEAFVTEVADVLQPFMEQINALTTQVEVLTKELTELKTANSKLETQLTAKIEEELPAASMATLIKQRLISHISVTDSFEGSKTVTKENKLVQPVPVVKSSEQPTHILAGLLDNI